MHEITLLKTLYYEKARIEAGLIRKGAVSMAINLDDEGLKILISFTDQETRRIISGSYAASVEALEYDFIPSAKTIEERLNDSLRVEFG